MLTERSLKTIGTVIKAYHSVGLTSLNFNTAQNQFDIPKSFLHRWLPPFNSACILLYAILNTVTLIQLILSPDPVAPVTFIWLAIYTSARVWGVASQLRVHLLNPAIAYFYNCLIYFHRRIAKTDILKEKSQGNSKSVDFLNVTLLYYGQLSLAFTSGVIGMLILQPKRPVFLYPTMNPTGQFSLDFTFFFCIVFELWITSSVMHTILNDGVALITIYVLVTSSYLSKLDRRFSRHSMNPVSSISFYSCLSILEKIHQDSLGFSAPVIFTALGILWTLGTVGSLRMFHVVSPADYLVLSLTMLGGGIALVTMIHFSGNLPLHGRLFITNVTHTFDKRYESKGTRKYLIAKGRSLRLFGIRCDPIRLIKHHLIYLYFDGLINNIVTFLTAYPTFPY